MIATALAVAFIVYSCKSQVSDSDHLDLTKVPLQTVDDMSIVQTENGNLQMRVNAGRMEKYDNDSTSFDKFPKGIEVFSYTDDGVLETTIRSDQASHEKSKKTGEEIWKAFGNVIIRNIVNQQTMETDTIYWDRKNSEIYTDCYIRMYSPDGFVQGFGMRSDEKAQNAIILKPFNSNAVVVQDTTEILIDSVNFIGPLLKKK